MAFKEARERAGKSVLEVSRFLGVSPQAVYQWEWGETAPRLSFLGKMADMYGCTVDELLSANQTGETARG